MLRSALIALALACAFAVPATAQPAQTSAPQSQQLARAATQLAALWRAVPPGRMTEATLTHACDGAIEEMAALQRRLPDPITVNGLADIRAEHGLVFVPTDENPTLLFAFPNDDLRGIATGLGSFRLDPAGGEGKLIFQDAAGHDSNLEIGHAGRFPLLRVRPRGSEYDVQLYVYCVSSL
ncbi:hypothetical protein [Terricaulis sp.]|uniref:hypothetical protein n=1 Tax=Terricaulis sp. TaxID=2768686 RepID=UPI003782DCE3